MTLSPPKRVPLPSTVHLSPAIKVAQQILMSPTVSKLRLEALRTPTQQNILEDFDKTPTASNIKIAKQDSDSYEFNAPQFHDFTAEEQENVDEWFGSFIFNT